MTKIKWYQMKCQYCNKIKNKYLQLSNFWQNGLCDDCEKLKIMALDKISRIKLIEIEREQRQKENKEIDDMINFVHESDKMNRNSKHKRR